MNVMIEVINPPEIVSGQVTYTLANSSTDYNFNEHDFEVLQSVINGDRDIESKGNYFNGKITVFKQTYENYLAMSALIGTVVTFRPFGYGVVTGGGYHPQLDCIITEVKPFHHDTLSFVDAFVISLISEKFYTLDRYANVEP